MAADIARRQTRVSILISVDSGLIPGQYIWNCDGLKKFQSLFQWIPVLYQAKPHRKRKKKKQFQSLFQWIPVLYQDQNASGAHSPESFNPYFSGFRSYTAEAVTAGDTITMFQSLFQWIPVLYLDSGYGNYGASHVFQSLFQWIPVLYRIKKSWGTISDNTFQSLFQWIPVLYKIREHPAAKEKKMFQSLFQWIPVLYHNGIKSSTYKLVWFQSLFQWIPVLYPALSAGTPDTIIGFNPYFSGFRSYTTNKQRWYHNNHRVSILISVDSGLIPSKLTHLYTNCIRFQSLFQWIPVLYRRNIFRWYKKGRKFQSLFQWIPVLYQEVSYDHSCYVAEVSILISVDSGLIPLNNANSISVYCVFQSLFQWIPVLYRRNIFRWYKKGRKFQSLFQWIPVLYLLSSLSISFIPGLFQSLFQWIPVLYQFIDALYSKYNQEFQSLFQWIPVLYRLSME